MFCLFFSPLYEYLFQRRVKLLDGFEDEIVIGLALNHLFSADTNTPDPKKMQMELTGREIHLHE